MLWEDFIMGKINWKQKLTSRKFATALIGFITAILIAFKVPNMNIEQVVATVSALLVLVAYIMGESTIDAERVKMEYLNKTENIVLSNNVEKEIK
jgi:uncharacterized membrane protein